MSAMTAIALPKENESPLIEQISIATIKPSKANPRRRMDETAMEELAESIRTHGVLQPILIPPVAAGAFEIACAERRWKASETFDLVTFESTVPERHLSTLRLDFSGAVATSSTEERLALGHPCWRSITREHVEALIARPYTEPPIPSYLQ
jgi:hypothetical protein